MEFKELQEICLSITDCHHSTPEYTESGKVVLRNFNIKNGRLIQSDLSYTNEDSFKVRIARAVPEPGDIVITREAPMGEVCIIPEEFECCLGQRMVLLKPNHRKVDSNYLLYSLMSKYVQTQIFKSENTGSIVSNLRIPLLRELKIPIVDFERQESIGRVLKNLDDKIELNNRINAELEQMAKTLYDYWFVQFDFPNEHGKPYKSSGGKMVYDEVLRIKIPEAWKAKTLGDLFEISNDSVSPQDDPEKEFKHYSIPIWDALKNYGLELGSTINSIKFVVSKGDILVSKLNPWFNRVIYNTDENDMICSTEFVILKTSSEFDKAFLHQVLTSEKFIRYSVLNAMGTSNSHKRVNPQDLISYALPYDFEIVSKFGMKIYPLLEKIEVNRKQNQQLASLRDWLLPMLMNGQVSVGEILDRSAENSVGQVETIGQERIQMHLFA